MSEVLSVSFIAFDWDELSSDEFVEDYRGYQIFLSIPNGGILGAGIRRKDGTGDSLLFTSEFLTDRDLYHDDEFHVSHCKKKIDEIMGGV